MHKIAFLLLLLAIPIYFFGIDDSKVTNKANIERMIKNRAFLNNEGNWELQTASKSLTVDQKQDLFQKYQINFFLNFLPNIIVPGLGSWLVGDYTGALVIEIGLLGGFGSFILGYSFGHYHPLGLPFAFSGFIIMLVSAALDLILPLTFNLYYNNNLQNALNIISFDFRTSENFTFNSSFEKQNTQLVQLNFIQLRF